MRFSGKIVSGKISRASVRPEGRSPEPAEPGSCRRGRAGPIRVGPDFGGSFRALFFSVSKSFRKKTRLFRKSNEFSGNPKIFPENLVSGKKVDRRCAPKVGPGKPARSGPGQRSRAGRIRVEPDFGGAFRTLFFPSHNLSGKKTENRSSTVDVFRKLCDFPENRFRKNKSSAGAPRRSVPGARRNRGRVGGVAPGPSTSGRTSGELSERYFFRAKMFPEKC